MSVPTTTGPKAGPQQPRSHLRRWLTAAVAGAVIAAGIAIAAGDAPDGSRPPSGNPPSTQRTAPSYPRDWTYSDPRRR
jgi:hypothetical protein